MSSLTSSRVLAPVGTAGKLFGFRDNDRNGHALEVNFMIGKEWFVRNDAADLVFSDDVFGSHDSSNPGRSGGRSCVY